MARNALTFLQRTRLHTELTALGEAINGASDWVEVTDVLRQRVDFPINSTNVRNLAKEVDLPYKPQRSSPRRPARQDNPDSLLDRVRSLEIQATILKERIARLEALEYLER